jgi:hypothetical protein
MSKKIVIAALITMMIVVVNIYWLSQTSQLEREKGYLNDQLAEKQHEIDRYTRPKVILITHSFFDNNNFTGIVFNEGKSMAHNVRISLIEKGVDYEVYIGDVEGQHSARFSEYVPTNPAQPFNMYFMTVLWNEKAYDQ